MIAFLITIFHPQQSTSLTTLAPCEYGINERIYFHSYLCCQHIFAISLKLICLLQFFSCTWEEILSQLLVEFMSIFRIWLIFLFLISSSTCIVLYLIYAAVLFLITLCRFDFIQAQILFPFSQIQPNETRKEWRYYTEMCMNKHFFHAFTNFSPRLW